MSIPKAIQNALSAEHEEQTERNGYVSYRGEWHALAWGLACGILAGLTGDFSFLSTGIGWLFTRTVDKHVIVKPSLLRELRNEALYVIAHAPAGFAIGVGLRFVAVALSGGDPVAATLS